MFKPVRVVATVLLFASIAMTFVSAFVLPAILCIVFVIVSARGACPEDYVAEIRRSNILPSYGTV
jgi:hypothetical protein